jgi:hypothetical protein
MVAGRRNQLFFPVNKFPVPRSHPNLLEFTFPYPMPSESRQATGGSVAFGGLVG